MTLPCLARGLARMREQSNLRQPETNITRHFNNSNILPVKKSILTFNQEVVCVLRVVIGGQKVHAPPGQKTKPGLKGEIIVMISSDVNLSLMTFVLFIQRVTEGHTSGDFSMIL